MEAKDRKRFKVMKTIGYGTYSEKELKQYLEDQAEITWRARDPEIAEAKLAGIREVVEEIGLHCYIWHDKENKSHICLDVETWQDQLKKWGV